jgi:hypothetical protein
VIRATTEDAPQESSHSKTASRRLEEFAAGLMGYLDWWVAGGGVDLWFVLGYDQGFVRGFGFF